MAKRLLIKECQQCAGSSSVITLRGRSLCVFCRVETRVERKLPKEQEPRKLIAMPKSAHRYDV